MNSTTVRKAWHLRRAQHIPTAAALLTAAIDRAGDRDVYGPVQSGYSGCLSFVRTVVLYTGTGLPVSVLFQKQTLPAGG